MLEVMWLQLHKIHFFQFVQDDMGPLSGVVKDLQEDHAAVSSFNFSLLDFHQDLGLSFVLIV